MLTLIATYDNSKSLVNFRGEKILTVPAFETQMRNITLGCTVIMGRETFETSKLLNHRNYIVLTTNKDYKVSNPKVLVIHSPEEIMQYLEDKDIKHAYVIGGAKTFSSFFKYAIRFIVCHVHSNMQGHEKFPHFKKKDYHIEVSACKQFYDRTDTMRTYTWHKETYFKRDESKKMDMRRSKVPLALSVPRENPKE